MNENDQLIAIAEACGWKRFRWTRGQHNYSTWVAPDEIFPPSVGSEHFVQRLRLPDYTHDLNAMREAEKTLTPLQRNRYSDMLRRIAFTEEESVYWDCAHATAAQRAEAFLKTLNLWKE